MVPLMTEVEEDDTEWSQTLDPLVSPAKKTRSTRCRPPIVSKWGNSRVIIHVDIDCFYAQVEMLRDPSLRDRPLGIQQKSIVVTCNYVARARGVSKLSLVSEAKRKCPDLLLVRGEDLTRYRDISRQVFELMQRYTPNVERLGLDECFLDVTDEISAVGGQTVAGHLYTGKESVSCVDSLAGETCNGFTRLVAGSQLAAKIRSDLVNTVGLTSCAGIAHSKLLAKLGGSLNKPNAQTTILPQFSDDLLNSLKVSQIPWIGRKTCELLAGGGLELVSDVRKCSYDKLSELLAGVAPMVYLLCHGIDDSEVVPSGAAKQYSVEDSFHQCSTVEEAYDKLDALCRKLLERYHRDEQDNRFPQTARISVRKHLSYHRESRQCTLPLATFLTNDIDKQMKVICTVFRSLFSKAVDVHKPFYLTLINVAFTGLSAKDSSNAKLDQFLQPLSVQPALPPEELGIVKTKKSVPNDVDVTVFETLPEDIQRELLESWKNSTVSGVKRLASEGKQTGIKKYFNGKSSVQQKAFL